MTTVAKNWASRFRSGHLSSSDAWLSLMSTVIKMFEYPLVALTLSRIVQPSNGRCFNEGLPKTGVARRFPRDVMNIIIMMILN